MRIFEWCPQVVDRDRVWEAQALDRYSLCDCHELTLCIGIINSDQKAAARTLSYERPVNVTCIKRPILLERRKSVEV
jgi:hypothetical protein